MTILRRYSAIALAVISLSGCYADDDDLDAANRQIAQLQQQISSIEQSTTATAAELAEAQARLAFLLGLTSQQDKAEAVLNALQSGDTTSITEFVSANTYIQHNLSVPDGRGALLGFASNASVTVDVRRIMVDGEHVIFHSNYVINQQAFTGFDIFRFNEAGLIVEHWDNLQAIDGDTMSAVNGNSLLDGALDITDLGNTNSNKALVQDFVEDVLVGGSTAHFDNFFNADPGDGSNYIQHNPAFPNGTAGVKGFLQNLESQGASLYTELHQVYAMGNMVLTLAEGDDGNLDGQPDGFRTAFFDLFRVEAGKIVEHWDVIQAIPDESEWANNNGKFYPQENYERRAQALLQSLAVSSEDAPYTASINTWQALVSESQYIQHNQRFPDGRQAVLDAFSNGVLDGTDVDIRRTFNDGDIVVAHSQYQLFGAPQVGFDVFRFAEGVIVEHWDNLMLADGDAASPNNGNSLLDGFLVTKDKDQTNANKALVQEFVQQVLVAGNLSNFADFFNADPGDGSHYIQHNPDFPNGTAPLQGFLQQLSDAGQSLYSSLEFVYGEGNWVLTMSESQDADFDGITDPSPTAFYDLFRVDAGKIVEHWDVIEGILPPEEAANNNSKW